MRTGKIKNNKHNLISVNDKKKPDDEANDD